MLGGARSHRLRYFFRSQRTQTVELTPRFSILENVWRLFAVFCLSVDCFYILIFRHCKVGALPSRSDL